jgi:acid-sensing ion channel, other
LFILSISKDFNYDNDLIKTRFDGQNPKEIPANKYPLKSSGEIYDGFELKLIRNNDFSMENICISPTFSIHSPYEFPDAFDDLKFYKFDYGKTLDIMVVPEVIWTDEDLIDVAPKKRNCFFDGESELKFFKTYTKTNCEMECYADYLFKRINCTPYYFVREESERVCDLVDIGRMIYAENSSKLRECNCMERCNSIKYKIELVQNLLRPKENES